MYEIYCKLRNTKRCKDADVAKATGITKSTFSDWKNGRSNPKDEKLRKIADYFDVSLEYLTGNSFIEEMGHILQEERIDLGLSQEEVAEEAGISADELNMYESLDEPIREDIFNDIAHALGTTYLELSVKYDLYSEYIPSHFNGDVVSYEAFKKAQARDAMNENLSGSVAKNDTERRLLMLCRRADDASKEEKEAILNQFEASIDMYLKAKGVIKE